ncbi:hypothetical protein [Candidatus Uabimicrobium sp. HlEnr_7]|uniref:hypothetical protein n=1 Tax=Candidatus Uabimicrobium helgolandensis TaxID=3095367 RepID=UPI0035569ADD
MKSILFLIIITAIVAQNKNLEIREYNMESIISKMGIVSLIPEGWQKNDHLQGLKKHAEQAMKTKLRHFLSHKNLQNSLEYIEVYEKSLVISATENVHKYLKKYIVDPFIDKNNFFFHINVELFPVTKEQLVTLKKTGILEKEKQFAEDIDLFLKESFRGIFSAGNTNDNSRKKLHHWFKTQKISAKSASSFTVANGFLNKLAMKDKKAVNYIHDYHSVKVVNRQEILFIPQIKQIKQHLDIWLVPNFKTTDSEGRIFIRFDSVDYDEPIHTKETVQGPIHTPRIYTSRVTYEVGPTKLPVSFYTLVGAGPNIYMQLVKLTPFDAKNNNSSGKVIGYVSRKIQLLSQKSETLLPQLVLETKNIVGAYIGSTVHIFDENNQLVANGYITKLNTKSCLVEIDREITLNAHYTYVIYRNRK